MSDAMSQDLSTGNPQDLLTGNPQDLSTGNPQPLMSEGFTRMDTSSDFDQMSVDDSDSSMRLLIASSNHFAEAEERFVQLEVNLLSGLTSATNLLGEAIAKQDAQEADHTAFLENFLQELRYAQADELAAHNEELKRWGEKIDKAKNDYLSERHEMNFLEVIAAYLVNAVRIGQTPTTRE
ncbi:hypothetical protein NLJ89_g8177 [Agrocybe chaxingu]|uniref:Uncharacterized protein n=1 Tax=Agrocybe chaxingu TaxID=84603 RepID=A0A9W8JXX0_9AGAR|nr:hypothetical protein NLJ89_g8177 [Agrocybe chaxingu]